MTVYEKQLNNLLSIYNKIQVVNWDLTSGTGYYYVVD